MTIDLEALEALQTAWAAQASPNIPKSSKGAVHRLPLSAIRVHPALYQARGTKDHQTGIVDKHHVTVLAASLRGSSRVDLDPITVLKINADHILVDGHHRLAAYRTQKRKDIPVRYFDGSPREALLEAGRENGKARLQMAAGQKSERAWTLVVAGCGSIEQQALGSGVTPRQVSNMRKRLKEFIAAGESVPATWQEVLRGRFDADPEAIPKMVAAWAEAIGKALPSPAKFNTGKVGILGDALLKWSPAVAERLALYFIDELNLQDVVKMTQEQRADEEAEVGSLGF